MSISLHSLLVQIKRKTFLPVQQHVFHLTNPLGVAVKRGIKYQIMYKKHGGEHTGRLCLWSTIVIFFIYLTWMVFVIFRGGAAAVCVCVPPMLLLRLSLSRASIILLLLLICGIALLLSPCTVGANCLVFTLARLLLVCICICGTRVWPCSLCVTACICVVCAGTPNWLCPCLRELIIWRASCTPPAPPLPRILKRASFWPSFSLASFTWNTAGRQKNN